MARGKPIELAHKIADRIDLIVARDGLPPLIPKGYQRFNFDVQVQHDDGASFAYHNAYAVICGDWLMIFPEHHDVNVMHMEEVNSWSMSRRIPEWPRVDYDENLDTVKLIVRDRDDFEG